MWSPVQYVIDNWEVDSYPEFSDLRYLVVLACIFPFLRYVLDSFVFEVRDSGLLMRGRLTAAGARVATSTVLRGGSTGPGVVTVG